MVLDPSARLQRPLLRSLYRLAAPVVERGLSIRDFNELCGRISRRLAADTSPPSAARFFRAAREETKARSTADLPAGFQFPRQGPLVIVSNHPFGLLDPVILGAWATQQREDVRFLTNHLLGAVEELRPWIIQVDPFNQPGSAKRNLHAMKEALRHLRGGGCLVVFPAGEVAHWQPGLGIHEGPWHRHVGALVQRGGAAVLPVFFSGANSPLFHAAGLVHPRLRTGLLLRELFHRPQSPVTMHVGAPIPFSRLRHFDDEAALTRFLRLHTLVLGRRCSRGGGHGSSGMNPQSANTGASFPGSRNAALRRIWEREVAEVRASGGELVSQGKLTAFIAGASQIPAILREIGRLRAISFAAVGEGTGAEIDLDRFDASYQHLFLWDEEAGNIAGAYRLGHCDELLRARGPGGLYTSTLFHYKKPFLQHLDDALEMGRSFLAPAYQRSAAALPLLWKAISVHVSRHPRYTKLFGPVSISHAYARDSRRLIVEFLRGHSFDSALAELVKPRAPFRYPRNNPLLREFISADLRDADELSALISSLEEDGKGLPVLLKHYLRLNATLLSFNVDRAFSCLDGLILVDLRTTEPKLLARYMGTEAAAKYLGFHSVRLET